MDEVLNTNDVLKTDVEAREANASDGRPTMVGTQHGTRLFCAHCGAHNTPGWTSCHNCGASRPAVSNGHRYAAALGAAMVSAATFLMMWRLAHVPVTPVVIAPTTVTTIDLYTPVVVAPPAEQVTVVRQYPGGAISSYTCRTSACTGTIYTSTLSDLNGQVVEYRTDEVEETVPAIVAAPVEGGSALEGGSAVVSPQPMLAPSEEVVATTGGNRRQPRF